ncbi:MAG: 16S rRNA (cytosine(1402)-N(4))-methyltransferase, partial [Acidimicrobiales bacterium]
MTCSERLGGGGQHRQPEGAKVIRLVRSPSIGEVEDSYSAHFHLSRSERQPDGILPVEGLRSSRATEDRVYEHRPVMESEVLELFAPLPSGLVLDATVGGGGHADAILEEFPHLSLLGFDRDELAVDAARERLRRWGTRAEVVHARFDELEG